MRRHEEEVQRRGYALVAGVDEAGRGPLAGPVVSAAVIWPERPPSGMDESWITDSKKLSPARREKLAASIREHAVAVGVAVIGPEEIDRINILRAALRSMAEAVNTLSPAPDYLLIDGNFPIPGPWPQRPIVKGDSLSLCIAAASIIAKVERDRIMMTLHALHPGYGFDRHKGYPTPDHRDAIRRLGPSPVHRRTFKGVREFLPPAHPETS